HRSSGFAPVRRAAEHRTADRGRGRNPRSRLRADPPGHTAPFKEPLRLRTSPTRLMRIATWNVNSVRARLDRLVPWLQEHRPDVVCLQETKVADELFPYEFLEDCGYNVTVYGQKTYNGVAVLARHGIEAVVKGFPGAGEL